MAKDYTPQESQVKVIYNDGEVVSFTITASNGIAHHLMNEAAKTGVIVMRDDVSKKSFCIPLAAIRQLEIETLDPHAVVGK